MVRHCSVCRSTAHDRRNCPRLAKNPEFYGYPPHPIRHGKGVHRNNGEPYDPNKAKGDEKVAKRARQVAKGSPATRKANSRPEIEAANFHKFFKGKSEAERVAIYNRLDAIRRGEVQRPRNMEGINIPALLDTAGERIPARARTSKERAERALLKLQRQQRDLYKGVDQMSAHDAREAKYEAAPKYARLKRREEKLKAAAAKMGIRV